MLQDQPDAGICLVFKVGSLACALPIACVLETMRPLPIQQLDRAPELVLGLAMVRGVPTPVVDTARLLGARSVPAAGRFITIVVGERPVALAVTAVWGVRAVSPQSLQAMPPLFAHAENAVVAAIGALDHELLLLLQGVRLIPESAFAAAQPGAEAR